MLQGHYFFEMTVKVAYGTSVFKTNLVFSEHIPSLIAAVGLYFGLTLGTGEFLCLCQIMLVVRWFVYAHIDVPISSGWAQPLTVALAALEVGLFSFVPYCAVAIDSLEYH